MNASPPLPQVMDKDDEHLQLLAVCHFINALLLLAGTIFLVVHYFIMRMAIEQIKARPDATFQSLPVEVQQLMLVFYLVFGIGLLFVAVLNIVSAISLRRRKRRMLSLITAGLNCIQFPFGTVLGIFTVIVLCRNSVRAKYDAVADAEAEALED